jgi:hypothetical protein
MDVKRSELRHASHRGDGDESQGIGWATSHNLAREWRCAKKSMARDT